jgi:hypothetical protein
LPDIPLFGNDTIAKTLATGGTLHEKKFSTRFEGYAAHSLVIWYEPSVSACLHILSPQDSEASLYSEFLRLAARTSSLARISSESNVNELAAQYNQWKDVIVLWNTVQSKGLYPSYGAEYLPFIRAYLRTQNYLEAQALIEAANHITSSQAMRQTLCRSWLEAEIMEPAIKSEVTELLKCQP